MNSITHLKRVALAEKIYNALIEAKSERGRRSQHVRTILGDEPGWVVHEREIVQRLVNAERERQGAEPIGMIEIVSAEQAATYNKEVKFVVAYAQAAADLALGRTTTKVA